MGARDSSGTRTRLAQHGPRSTPPTPLAMRWRHCSSYQQATPHDPFARDLALSPLVDVGGDRARARRIAVATGKVGFVIGHDIDRGDVLWTTSVGLHP